MGQKPFTTAAILSAASAPRAGMAWLYKSSVTVIELWPRRSDMTLGWMCAARPSVAWVWRRSWKFLTQCFGPPHLHDPVVQHLHP